MADTIAAAIATNRFGLGARPGDIAGLASDPRGALKAQLRGAAAECNDSSLPGSAQVLERAAQLRLERKELRRDSPATAAGGPTGVNESGSEAALRESLLKLPGLFRPFYVDDVTARVRAAVMSDQPFFERLVHFWTNHFAVSVDKVAVLGIAGAFEREAIRPHVLGSFPDMLVAVEQHPAMLLYLDNA